MADRFLAVSCQRRRASRASSSNRRAKPGRHKPAARACLPARGCQGGKDDPRPGRRKTRPLHFFWSQGWLAARSINGSTALRPSSPGSHHGNTNGCAMSENKGCLPQQAAGIKIAKFSEQIKLTIPL